MSVFFLNVYLSSFFVYVCFPLVVARILNPRIDDMPYMLYLLYTCLGLFWLFSGGGCMYNSLFTHTRHNLIS